MGLQIPWKDTFSSLKSSLPWWTSYLHPCLSPQSSIAAEAGMSLLGVTYSQVSLALGIEVTVLL